MNLKSDDLFNMAGTEKTFEYVVVLATALGRIGYRPLGQGEARIRVEPFGPEATATLGQTFTADAGWKQPDEEKRFSLWADEDGCVPDGQGFLARLEAAATALLDATPTSEYRVNEALDEAWTADLADRVLRASLKARAKKLGVKGASIKWRAVTLASRCSEAEQS